MVEKRQGKCMCGSVTITLPADNPEICACHCTMCRKWGGGPLFSLHALQKPEITGEEHITSYASSDWAHRCFCKNCGTHLYYLYEGHDYYLSSGLFENESDLKLARQIFVDEKSPIYDLANDTPMLTRADVLALHGVEED